MTFLRVKRTPSKQISRAAPKTPSPATPLKTACVVPAYNEEKRIGAVLQTLTQTPELDEIIVVCDGCTDKTASVACAVPGVQTITLAKNRGKGGAMREGASRTDADILIFFDADLVGLKPEHVKDLLAPLQADEAAMTTGVFRGGRWLTDMAQKLVPGITGQRAIRRDVFLGVPDLEKVGYGIELAINAYVESEGLVRRNVILRGVTHPMKEEKLGPLRGLLSRLRMYGQMARFRLLYARRKKAREK